jgi:hypothetical protein
MAGQLTGPSRKMQEYLAPWLEWAEAEPMASKIVMALNLLDADKDAMVHFEDFSTRAASRRHTKVTHHRNVRELFEELGKHAEGKKELRHNHVKKTLQKLSAEELADVMAELPTFLAKQPKPLMLRMFGDKFVGEVITRVVTEPLTRIGAAHLTPDVAIGLLAAMGSQVKQEKSKR